jgi:hypothetical protein
LAANKTLEAETLKEDARASVTTFGQLELD